MRRFWIIGAFAISFFTQQAHANDRIVNIPLADVLAMPEAQSKLNSSIKLYLEGDGPNAKTEKLGEVVVNRKTNAFAKEDLTACRWVALSALIALQEEATKRGANVVIDIVSYYKKNVVKSSANIECHAGALIAGVALKGQLAKTGAPDSRTHKESATKSAK